MLTSSYYLAFLDPRSIKWRYRSIVYLIVVHCKTAVSLHCSRVACNTGYVGYRHKTGAQQPSIIPGVTFSSRWLGLGELAISRASVNVLKQALLVRTTSDARCCKKVPKRLI